MSTTSCQSSALVDDSIGGLSSMSISSLSFALARSFASNASLRFSNSRLLSSCPRRGTATRSFRHLVPSFTGVL